MNYITCYLLLTTDFFNDKLSTLNRNGYDLAQENQHKKEHK